MANLVAGLASRQGFHGLKLARLPLHFLPFEPVPGPRRFPCSTPFSLRPLQPVSAGGKRRAREAARRLSRVARQS